jgi:hypothetical protein
MNRFQTFLVFLISFAIYFISTEHLFATVQFPTGDEPYYLLIAHSLVYDHDFELTNNFDNQDYRLFYPGDLFPRHEAVTPKPILVSKHSLGLPLLIAPGYALDGWSGAAHTMNLLGALLAVNVFLLASEASGSRPAAWLVWAALAFAAPLFTYAELIFPEAPAALLTVYAWRKLRAWDQANDAQKLLAVMCIALLPWLHARFLFVVAGLAFYLWANGWRAQRRAEDENAWSTLFRTLRASAWLWVPLLASAFLLIGYDLYVYASPLPNYADHSGTGAPAEIFAAFFGVWLDQQWGLLTHAPVYLLALGALWLWRRGTSADAGYGMPDAGYAVKGRESLNPVSWIMYLVSRISDRLAAFSPLTWFAIIALPYFVLIVQYRYWWGEWCPPARYLTPLLPLLAGPLALAVVHLHMRRFRISFAALMLIGWCVTAMFAVNGHLMFNQPLGHSELLVALKPVLGIDLTAIEPSFMMMFLRDVDPVTWVVNQSLLTVAWLLALSLIGLTAFGFDWDRKSRRRVPVQLPSAEA